MSSNNNPTLPFGGGYFPADAAGFCDGFIRVIEGDDNDYIDFADSLAEFFNQFMLRNSKIAP